MGGWNSGKGGGKGKDRAGGYGGRGQGKAGGGGSKPTDSPDFVQWSEGMRLEGSKLGVSYIVESYVASGTFSRVFRVRRAPGTAVNLSAAATSSAGAGRRWGKSAEGSAAAAAGDDSEAPRPVLAAKVMRKHDTYIQYSSDAQKEGEMLHRVEQAQSDAGEGVQTMRCLDSFETTDTAGAEYWCLILEWLDASIFDLVNANGNRGLHLSMVRIMLLQLFQQLHVLQKQQITHTDIKHKNCCLADGEHFMVPAGPDGKPTIILTNPMAKFIDYGNAVFEGDKKVHPIMLSSQQAAFLFLSVICFVNLEQADARCADPAVCVQWYNDIYYQTEYGSSLLKIESLIEKQCEKIGDTKPMSKMCYYMLGVKRTVSKDMKQGAPAELACKRYTAADDSICELRFPKKLDASMNLEKMRVKELRHLMQEYEVECINCLEKSDMIKRIRETIMKPTKEL